MSMSGDDGPVVTIEKVTICRLASSDNGWGPEREAKAAQNDDFIRWASGKECSDILYWNNLRKKGLVFLLIGDLVLWRSS